MVRGDEKARGCKKGMNKEMVDDFFIIDMVV